MNRLNSKLGVVLVLSGVALHGCSSEPAAPPPAAAAPAATPPETTPPPAKAMDPRTP